MCFEKGSRLLALALFFVGCVCSASLAQTALVDPLLSSSVEVSVDSGKIYHSGEDKDLVWSETITVPDAMWMRLKFDQIVLAGSPLGGESSTLKITSLLDGKFQTLNAKTARQWRNTSAYFNGNEIKLELFAAPNGRLNLIQVSSATAGDPEPPDFTETICDGDDDRQLSDDPRAARGEPIGCTCWLFNDRNNCFITAGHCMAGTDVAMFNVPLSDNNGNPNFPGPEDQYSVDLNSVQFVNGGVGNDWAYFGCFPNANTGLTAFEAQGDSFQLGIPGPVEAGDQIRITGYGSTSFPVDPTWDQAQKTHVGDYFAFSDEDLRYRTDTTGGNSGSPVIFEETGEAIGVHTHGGCGDGGGSNAGTAIIQNGFSTALNNPLGICITTIDFTFPNGLPMMINPAGGDEIVVATDDSEFDIDPTSAKFFVDSGPGFVEFPMIDLGSNLYLAVFPPTDCGSVVRYYFSIDSTQGETFTSPIGAPNNVNSAISAVDIASVPFSDDFEADLGWSVSGSVSTGQWERGIPAGGGERNDPPQDADGSGQCYLTENAPGNTDVDDGTTVLTSPIMDATSGMDEEAIVSYFRWFDSSTSGDTFRVEISNDGGSSWQDLEVIDNQPSESTGGWKLAIFTIADVVEPTDQMRLRFSVGDTNDPSIVEAGIDAVRIDVVSCSSGVLLGDVNLDGFVNLLDVAPFVDLLSNGGFQAEADINSDGAVNLLDVSLFVEILQN